MLAETLLKISIKDLEASEQLYKLKYFPQAYFYFQQATEKANKAMGLWSGIITEKECQKFSHDQFKIYKKGINEQKEKIEKHFQIMNRFPNISPFPSIAKDQTGNHYKNLNSAVSFLDSLNNIELSTLNTSDLNYFLNSLDSILDYEFKIPKTFDTKIDLIFKSVIDWISSFPTVEAKNMVKEMSDFYHDISKRKEFKKFLIQYIKSIQEIAFIETTFYYCAILTIQHSSNTRYPNENCIDPSKIYKAGLPIVRKQPEFMAYLSMAQVLLKKFIRKSNTNG